MRAAARQGQLAETQTLEQAFSQQFLCVHLQDFPDATAPIVPDPEPVDRQRLQGQFEQHELQGIPWFKRTQRKQAREQARQQALAEAARQAQDRQAEHHREQQAAEDQWRKLLANDPQAVVATLESAFEHLQLPAAALDCTDEHATVLIRFPPVDGVVPEQEPALTPTGRPTMKRRTKTSTNQLYAAALLSHSLAAGREALAACLGLREVSVIVVSGGQDATSPLIPLSVVRVDRPTVEQIDWSRRPEAAAVALRFERLMLIKGQADELAPLSLVDEPDVAHVVELVAQHLGVPVDERCRTPLQGGQVQHFAPVERPA